MAEFVEVMKTKSRMCKFYEHCINCPISIHDCATPSNPKEAEKIIMDWAKEHPIVTNKDKFKEVYGFEPSDYFNYENFWDKEYKEPKGDKE